MEIRKKIILFGLSLLLMLSGCGMVSPREEEPEPVTGYYLYEINDTETDLVERTYQPADPGGSSLGEELKEIINGKSEITLNLLPEDVYLREYTLEQSILTLDFSHKYGELSVIREILTRAALVKMFVQCKDVSAVVIQVEGSPIRDSRGTEIGPMTASTFTENMSKNLHSYRFARMTLYFADRTGSVLIPEERNVYYMSNLPLERVVLEQLIQGPAVSERYATLSKELEILSVVDSDGVCYINFDQSFISDVLTVNPEITIYSIVNSILEVCSVEKVQISIGGDSSQSFRDMMDLNHFYEKNEELIQEIKTEMTDSTLTGKEQS